MVFGSRIFTEQAIVLRTQKLGEADRIITFFTLQTGVIRAVAKGIRRTKSRYGARLEPFNHVQVQLRQGKSLYNIMQVETIAPYARLMIDDYGLYTNAQALLEVTIKLAGEDTAFPALFRLLLGALNALGRRRYDKQLVLDSFVIRALALSGWAPNIDSCVTCAKTEDIAYFSIASGGVFCTICKPSDAVLLSGSQRQGIYDLLLGNWEEVLTSSETLRDKNTRLIRNYLQWHIDKKLKSLKIVETK